MTEIINLQRRFQIWAYSVGHSLLLLRSNKSSEFSTRVEILFSGVAALKLPTTFEGLSIIEVSGQDETAGLDLELGYGSLTAKRVFVLRGSNFTGHVVASALFSHEDDKEHFDRSYFKEAFSQADSEFLQNIV